MFGAQYFGLLPFGSVSGLLVTPSPIIPATLAIRLYAPTNTDSDGSTLAAAGNPFIGVSGSSPTTGQASSSLVDKRAESALTLN